MNNGKEGLRSTGTDSGSHESAELQLDAVFRKLESIFQSTDEVVAASREVLLEAIDTLYKAAGGSMPPEFTEMSGKELAEVLRGRIEKMRNRLTSSKQVTQEALSPLKKTDSQTKRLFE